MPRTKLSELRGPAGYNATGAAEDDAAIAAFMSGAAGPSESRKVLAKSLAVPGQLMSVLRRARADAVLTFLGDSTGNETTEWTYQLVQWLAAQFPIYTVQYKLWDDATQSYPTTVIIQTGIGARILTVYNGAMPGAGFFYPYEGNSPVRLLKMIPVAPTTVVVSFGYNAVSSSYKAEQLELSRWVRGYFPKAEYVVVSQPPKSSADSDYANCWLRSSDSRAFAISNGYGLIDPAQAFSDYGNFHTDLIGPDGIHPNAAGQAVWLEEAKRYFDKDTPAVMPSGTPTNIDRFVVPAASFFPTQGAPVMGITSFNAPAFKMGDAALEIVATTVDIPTSWESVNVYALWSTVAGSAATNVAFTVGWMNLTDGVAVPLSGYLPTIFTDCPTQTAPGVANSSARQTKVFSREKFAGGRPIVFRFRRLGNDAADTFVGQMYFYGLVIERAE